MRTRLQFEWVAIHGQEIPRDRPMTFFSPLQNESADSATSLTEDQLVSWLFHVHDVRDLMLRSVDLRNTAQARFQVVQPTGLALDDQCFVAVAADRKPQPKRQSEGVTKRVIHVMEQEGSR